jgi:4-alpha-glucanotransferase
MDDTVQTGHMICLNWGNGGKKRIRVMRVGSGITDERKLRHTARQYGWQDEFWDGLGIRRQTSPESLRALMGTMPTAQSDMESKPTVAIAHAGSRVLQMAAGNTGRVPRQMELVLEDGEKVTISRAQVAHRGGRWQLRLDRPLPLGAHRLEIESGKKTHVVHILAAPARLTVPTDFPKVCVFVPLYAVHGNKSLGIGDTRDLGELVRWAGESAEERGDTRNGAGALVGTLPLYPTFGGQPTDVSPYRPETRLFWNEAYVDPRGMPEFAHPSVRIIAQGAQWRQTLAQARSTPYVDYGCVGCVKRELLAAMARVAWADPRRRDQIQAWTHATAEAQAYAQFRAKLEGGDADAVWYHLYAQAVAQEQMLAAARAGGNRGGLYLDLPVGVHPEGYDAHHHAELFLRRVSVGAPPDPLQERGQVWGMPALHPTAGRHDGYRHLRLVLQRIFTVARMLRIDHVMGLQRLYCVPDGADGRDGAYLQYPAEELYAVVMIEAARAGAVVVGESLGTLPPGMNEALARRGLLGMHVQQFAFSTRRHAIGRAQANDVTALNTHDTPTFAAFWKGDDVELRQRLGVIGAEEARQTRQERTNVRAAVTTELTRLGMISSAKPQAQDVGRALMTMAAKGRARIQVVNLEDWWGERRPQNVPGVETGVMNWRRRCRWSLERIVKDATLGQFLGQLAGTRRGARKSNRRTSHSSKE